MKIKYFAWIKDFTNKEYDLIEDNYPKNIEELKKILNGLYPDLQKHLSKEIIRFAINMEYISSNQDLKPDDEVAVFPPVSGG